MQEEHHLELQVGQQEVELRPREADKDEEVLQSPRGLHPHDGIGGYEAKAVEDAQQAITHVQQLLADPQVASPLTQRYSDKLGNAATDLNSQEDKKMAAARTLRTMMAVRHSLKKAEQMDLQNLAEGVMKKVLIKVRNVLVWRVVMHIALTEWEGLTEEVALGDWQRFIEELQQTLGTRALTQKERELEGLLHIAMPKLMREIGLPC